MPELVGLMHSLVGLAAVLIGLISYYASTAKANRTEEGIHLVARGSNSYERCKACHHRTGLWIGSGPRREQNKISLNGAADHRHRQAESNR